MLRRHSNPTKKSLVAPANQAFGRFWTTVFFLIGVDEFLQVFGGFSTGCGEAASSKIW